MKSRIARLREALKPAGLDGMLVCGPANLRWLCGYTGSNGILLVGPAAAFFYTDFRYAEQIRQEVRGCRRRVLGRELFSALPEADLAGISRLGIEENHLTVGRFRALKKRFRGLRIVPVEDITLKLRRTKDKTEVAAIERAQRLTDTVYAAVLKLVRPGVSEDDLAREIDFGFRSRGGEAAFTSIVASGPNAAKPHAGHGPRRLRKGDVITFDIGCRLDGYCSDMTRTVFLGRAGARLRQVYQIVLDAQQAALGLIRAGVAATEVDAGARRLIERAGFGPQFGHALGHGVGLEVHERPVLSGQSRDVLAVGDVVTVEPGIYLSGVGGVRIEDMVLVTATGGYNFTRSPKELVEL